MLVRSEDNSPFTVEARLVGQCALESYSSASHLCSGLLGLQVLELMRSAFTWALGIGTQVRLVQQVSFTHLASSPAYLQDGRRVTDIPEPGRS